MQSSHNRTVMKEKIEIFEIWYATYQLYRTYRTDSTYKLYISDFLYRWPRYRGFYCTYSMAETSNMHQILIKSNQIVENHDQLDYYWWSPCNFSYANPGGLKGHLSLYNDVMRSITIFAYNFWLGIMRSGLENWFQMWRGLGLGGPRGKGSTSVSKGPKAPMQLLQLLKNSPRDIKRAHFRYILGPPGSHPGNGINGARRGRSLPVPRFLQPWMR